MIIIYIFSSFEYSFKLTPGFKRYEPTALSNSIRIPLLGIKSSDVFVIKNISCSGVKLVGGRV